MKSTSKNIVPFLLLFMAVVLSGCAHRGPRSAYQNFYENRLAGARVPSDEEITSVKESEGTVVLGQPSQKVWDACLRLAAQSKGILGIADDVGGGHRLLFISGKNVRYKRDLWLFVDRWLAIGIRPLAESSTEVRIVFVSPETGRVAPFTADSFPRGFKGDANESISLVAGENLIWALKKSFAEDDYLSRLGYSRHPARGAPPKIDVKQIEHRESLAQRLGNFQSANIRRERYVLNVPRLEERIAAVVRDIAGSAGELNRETRVFVIADVLEMTHAEPNGDVFLTTGALDRIENVDELAGIVSHELAHLYLHHGAMRLGANRRAAATKNAVIGLGILGGAIAGGLLPTKKPNSPQAPQDTILSNREALIGAAVGLGTLYFGGQLGTSFGVGAGGYTVYRLSQKEELEADDYGAELLWAAGYDYRGFLKFLQKQYNARLFEAGARKRR